MEGYRRDVLELVRAAPDQTVRTYARRLGASREQLLRVLGGLEEDGAILRWGSVEGWRWRPAR